MSLTINVDFDGVISDFRAQAEKLLCFYGCHIAWPVDEDIPAWHFYKQWATLQNMPVTSKMFYTWVNRDLDVHDENYMKNGVFYAGPLIPYARSTILGLHQAGHHIRIVTSKAVAKENRREAMERTVKFLYECDIPFNSVVFALDTNQDKTDYRADVVIDDNPDWQQWAQPGAVNLMLAQPWNTRDQMQKHWEPLPRAGDERLVARAEWERISGWVQLVVDNREEYPEPLVIKDEDPMEPAEANARKALELVYGDRQADYGHPYDDYSRTVNAFNALTGHDLSVLEGGLFMVLVKLSRQMNVPKPDNMVDAHGYLLVMDRILERS